MDEFQTLREWPWRENRYYPSHILKTLAPRYLIYVEQAVFSSVRLETLVGGSDNVLLSGIWCGMAYT